MRSRGRSSVGRSWIRKTRRADADCSVMGIRRREAPDGPKADLDRVRDEDDPGRYSHEMPGPFQMPWRSLLIALGVLFLVAGLLWPFLARYVGRLPGDVVVKRGGWTFAFPIVTCLLLSLLISLLLSIFRR